MSLIQRKMKYEPKKVISLMMGLHTKFRLHKFTVLIWSVFRSFLLIGIGFILLYPLLYMISTAFRSTQDLWDPSVIWLPNNLTLEHVKEVFKLMEYPKVVYNTVSIGVVSALLQVVFCSFVGYGFARFKFPGKNILFGMVLLTIIVPPQTIIVPLYLEFRFFNLAGISDILGRITGSNSTINLINTGWVFYLPSILGTGLRSGLYIYIFRQFFRGMPKELENAALIDGCGPIRTYLRVMVPNAVPAFVTVLMFSVVWHWNDFYLSGMLMGSKETISVALAGLRDKIHWVKDYDRDPMLNQVRTQAGALLSILPMLLMFVVGQKYFTESVERTGIVG